MNMNTNGFKPRRFEERKDFNFVVQSWYKIGDRLRKHGTPSATAWIEKVNKLKNCFVVEYHNPTTKQVFPVGIIEIVPFKHDLVGLLGKLFWYATDEQSNSVVKSMALDLAHAMGCQEMIYEEFEYIPEEYALVTKTMTRSEYENASQQQLHEQNVRSRAEQPPSAVSASQPVRAAQYAPSEQTAARQNVPSTYQPVQHKQGLQQTDDKRDLPSTWRDDADDFAY